MHNESVFSHNEPCPRCQSKGKDKSGDNLGVYSDGHANCWACGFYRARTGFHSDRVQHPAKPLVITLPKDCDVSYPQIALNWVAKYGFNRVDLLRQGVLWSEHGVFINKKGELLQCKDMLVFPVWIDGILLGFNCRYFGDDARVPKWIAKGKLHNVYHILPGNKTLVVTEDILSAMKVQLVGHETMPVYGMHASSRWKNLRLMGYSKIWLWLDPDMGTQMVKQSREGSLEGLEVTPVFSERDPKEHNLEDIRRYLDGWRNSV